MSANAPLGMPSKKTGKLAAVCTSAIQMGLVVSEVIIQAAATSFIHMHTLAISHVVHSMRKTGCLNGASGDRSLSAFDCVSFNSFGVFGIALFEMVKRCKIVGHHVAIGINQAQPCLCLNLSNACDFGVRTAGSSQNSLSLFAGGGEE